MLLQVATWSLVFLASLALGFSALLVARSLGRHRRAFMLDVCGVVWLGFARVIAFLELASLCGRIGTVCVVILLAARTWLRTGDALVVARREAVALAAYRARRGRTRSHLAHDRARRE